MTKFTIGNYLVFPNYGIGKCDSYQQVNVDGKNYEMLVINFVQSKMVLKLPKDKLSNVDCSSLHHQLTSLRKNTKSRKSIFVNTKITDQVL